MLFVSADNYNTTPAPKYQVNESGETYGSALYATSLETEPDLIEAYGADGTLGYVKKTDLHGGVSPKSPEEALQLQEKAKLSPPRTIPLYKSDGKTVIGEFKFSRISEEDMNYEYAK